MLIPLESQVAKTLTQVVRYVTHGIIADVIEEVSVAGQTVTESQFELLRYIDRHERPTIKDVAMGLGISSAAATKAVQGLSDERATPLVIRTRGHDRRTVWLATTVEGRDLVRRAQALFQQRLDQVFDGMTSSERLALEQGLEGFLRASLRGPRDCDAACLRCGVDHRDDCLVFLAEVSSPQQPTARC